MPTLSLPDITICYHGDIHGVWVAQGIHWRVCNLPKPRLINSIDMLERTLDDGYPIIDKKLRLQTEDQLRILRAELERRNAL